MLSVPVFRKARAPYQVEYLLVAGGGGASGGGYHLTCWGAGGGAGGLLTGTATLTPNTTYNFKVGAGGAGTANTPGNNGGDTECPELGLKCIGGGGGGFRSQGKPGGSGGGSSGGGGVNLNGGGGLGPGYIAGGTSTAGQGNDGGPSATIADGSGGGGGAGTRGMQGGDGGPGNLPGMRWTMGGQGVTSSISGTSEVYAEGGSGFGTDHQAIRPLGGSGGMSGNKDSHSYVGSGANGKALTGSGGGAGPLQGGNGGDGCVILKIPAKFYRQENHKGAVQILARTPNHVIIQYKGDGYLIA